VVLKGSSVPGGVMASTLRSDGSGGDMLSLPAVYRNPMPMLGPEYSQNGHKRNTVTMNGRQVFRFATQVIASSIEETLAKAGLTIDDVALIVPHQANVRIIETAAKRLKIPAERFFMNVDTVGNTSAASIPIALCDAVSDGRLRPDDNVVFVGFGGGLTWAASVVKWTVTPPTVSLPRREWRRARYIIARARSQIKKWRRKIIDRISILPGADGSGHDADKK
jgi:3-oxoacyl-[acyl-carrier-protein] synthase-3